MLKPYLALAGASLTLVACTATEPQARVLVDSPMYPLYGASGLDSGQHLRFGQYDGKLDLGTLYGEHDYVMPIEKTQSGALLQSTPENLSATLEFDTSCYFQRRILASDISRNEISGTLTLADQSQWQLTDEGLTDGQGNKVRHSQGIIYYNQTAIMEFQLMVYQGGMSFNDYVWIDESAPDQQRLLASALLSFELGRPDLNCDQNSIDEDDGDDDWD